MKPSDNYYKKAKQLTQTQWHRTHNPDTDYLEHGAISLILCPLLFKGQLDLGNPQQTYNELVISPLPQIRPGRKAKYVHLAEDHTENMPTQTVLTIIISENKKQKTGKVVILQ